MLEKLHMPNMSHITVGIHFDVSDVTNYVDLTPAYV